MPIIDLGRIAYINKGGWNASTTYEQKDVVSYNGSSWVSLINNNTNKVPSEGEAWTLMSKSTYQSWLDQGNTGTEEDFIATITLVQPNWTQTNSTAKDYIKNKPSKFTPTDHTHAKSQITDFPISLPANGGNSNTVNGHTVNSDVPANAKFTDTTYSHPSFTARTSGLYKITVNSQGHVTGVASVTKADITALGIPSQDTAYTLPTASDTLLGGIKLGYATSGKNYKVQVDSNGNAYVNVPWTDNNSTYAMATTDMFGLVKIGYATNGKNYPVALDTNGKMYVNVPWTDTNTIYTHPTSSGNKHIPSGGTVGQILRWSADGTAVWGNDNNTTYSNFKAATASAAGGSGLVPAPAAGTHEKYLRADGTWQTPPDTNTTYGNMGGATASAAGRAGLVPAPATGKQTSFLRGDGTWATPPNSNTTYTFASGTGGFTVTPSGGSVQTISIGKPSTAGTADRATTLVASRSIDGVNFNGSANVVHYGTCSTAAATAAKDVFLSNFVLVTGSRVVVKFTVTNTAANPTLNVNGTGAKAIYYRGASISAGYLSANRTIEFIYNGTQYEAIGDFDTNTTYGTANTSANGLMTPAMVTKLNGIATNANNYTHPSSSGNKHIPSGGSSGQILRWSADGTAVWGADNNTTYSVVGANGSTGLVKNGSAVTSTSGYTACPIVGGVPYYKDTNTTYGVASTTNDGLMGKSDKTKLNSCPTATGLTKIQKITQSAYDALSTKDANTLYIIVG